MKLSIIFIIVFSSLLSNVLLLAQSDFFDLSKDIAYSSETGYGYDFKTKPQNINNKKPSFYSIDVEDGNYKVTFEIGSDEYDADTTIRTESRRLLVHNLATKKGEFKKLTYVVHKKTPKISDGSTVSLKEREKGILNWDDKLTFEFNGNAPAVKSLSIERDNKAVTLFLCGDSTVVDQDGEPWASWGQMIPTWFDENVCIANYAESGLTTTTFLNQKRLNKILDMIKPGDYVFVEFGHNDEKDKGNNAGAFLNYATNLRTYISRAKAKKANVVILSPTARRQFDGGKIVNTHGDYPEAARQVAESEGVYFVDLTALTTELNEAYGSSLSTKFYVHYPAGAYGAAALKDNTHFNPFGAYEISKCVVMGLKSLDVPFMSNLREEWKDFDPRKPDKWEDFKWVESPNIDTIKPDGS
jgi:lysophospholipase L1-like esterase